MIVWVAAYAFLLQSLFAPLLAAPSKMHGADANALASELCIHDDQAAALAGGGLPAGAHDNDDAHCQLCASCEAGVLIGPFLAAAWIKRAQSASLKWAVIDCPVPDGARLIGERARGPPLLA